MELNPAILINALASRLRTLRLASVTGIDAKRPRAWCEFGFPDHLDFDLLFRAYDRTAMGYAAADKTKSKTWQDHPWIIEGDETKESTVTTKQEQQLAQMAKRSRLWQAMAEADLMRLVGGWSYLIMRVADDQPLHTETKANTLDAIVEFIPAWRGQMTVERYTSDGITPLLYSYRQQGQQETIRSIHASRVIVIGQEWVGRSLLQAGYNELVTLEKICGGTGESFLKNAARQLHTNFGSDTDLEDIARQYGTDMAGLQEMMQQHASDLNAGNDVLMVTQGATVSTLTSAPADPKNAFDVATQAFAASVDIPVKILVGNVTGERASTEDNKQWAATCQARRIGPVESDITRLIERFVELGMLTDTEYQVMWNDLTEGTHAEKAETAGKIATVIQAYASAEQSVLLTGTEPVISREELRTELGYDNEA